MKKIYLILSIASLALTVLQSSCEDDCAVTVEGVVTDSLTGQPVEGVEVALFMEKHTFGSKVKDLDLVKTNSDGFYFLRGESNCRDSLWVRTFPFMGYGFSPLVGISHERNVVNFALNR